MSSRAVKPPIASANPPRHVAVIMDGNGRWAKSRALPRHAGHRAGVKAVRATVEGCARRGVEVLTLFAFSSENWKRPKEEVGRLMGLFLEALDREISALHKNKIRVRFIGDLDSLATPLRERIAAAQVRTAGNTRLTLMIAVAYGGQWDIARAARALAEKCIAGTLTTQQIDEAAIAQQLSLAGLPEPDLFIRTGGEQRVSNFLLWNLAYTELYFCDVLWPDFDERQLETALEFFATRQRRFGLAPTQSDAR